MGSPRKKGLTLLKIIFSVLLIYFVFTKIPFGDVWQVLKDANWTVLSLALILFMLSKAIAAVRLNYYFGALGIKLTTWKNGQLYLLGMFYNLFLPGGIGGDAYKGYLIRKEFGISTKRVVAILLLDRLSGLLLLFILAAILSFLHPWQVFPRPDWILAISAMFAVLLFWWVNYRFFHYVFPVFGKSLFCSALVQLAQLACVLFILKALSVESNMAEYLFVFLVSSIVAVLPITIGGIGSREVVFFYGAVWLGLDEGTSVSISLLFFLITALVSFSGIYFHFRKPVLAEEVEGDSEY